MEALHRTGSLRVQPASFFRDERHVGAIRDDEQSFPLSFALSREGVMKIVKNPKDVPPGIPDQRVDVQFQSPADYWLYCLSNSVEPRLFVDFAADACVIIRNRERFCRLLREASARDLSGTIMRQGPAMYVDPLLPESGDIFVPLCKHFRYAYQEEFRFCWLPLKPVRRLAHVDILLGSLEQISELITL